jgi:hypothetical protein
MGQQNDGDTISRRMAIDAMANTLWHYPNECYRNLNKYEFAKGLAELGLKSVPPAQPEIIRCKDCKHHHRDNSGAYYCGRKDYGYGWGLNDFCSDAERREDGR